MQGSRSHFCQWPPRHIRVVSLEQTACLYEARSAKVSQRRLAAYGLA